MSLKKIKILILTLLILTISENYIYSQTFSTKINWKSKREIKDSLNSFFLFDSENISFDKNLTPFYSNQINISNFYNKGFSYSLKPKNIKYIALNEAEISGIKNINKIPSNYIFDSKLQFARGIPYVTYKISSIIKNSSSGKYEKLISLDLIIEKTRLSSQKSEQVYAENSILSSGTWKKIRISESGLYKLTFDELESIGIDNPQNVRIFGNATGWLPMMAGDERPDDLVENDILIEGNSVIFYAQGADRWDYNETTQVFEPKNHFYSDYSYYFLTSDVNTNYNNTIKQETQSSLSETHNVSTYNSYAVHEENLYNIAETGRNWYGEIFDIDNNQDFEFSFPNLIDNQDAKIKIFVAATGTSNFVVNTNGTSKTISCTGPISHNFAARKTSNYTFNTGNSDNISINIKFNSNSPSTKSWLDYFYINAKSELKFTGGQMSFRNAETIGETNITKYTLSNAGSSVIIWDISDKTKPKKINASVSGNTQTFKLSSKNLKEFIAFDNSVFKKPELSEVEDVANQNLHATSGNTDMLIITFPGFISQANELKELHERIDGMNVKVVTQQQIYNEFSSGAADFSAIRDYVRMIYKKANNGDTLRYLLLFGDGSYDNKSGIGVNGNFMITYQQNWSEGLGNSYVTDDFFGTLDDNEGDDGDSLKGLLDIGIGRLIVSNVQQANEHIAKIKNYISTSTFGDWRNQLCFIADDENGVVHMSQTDYLTNYIKENHPIYNIDKIYLDAYTQYTESGGERYPDVNNAINSRIQKGSLILNYVGHGGEHGLAHERVITISEIESWRNFDKLSLFVTATCSFTRFDDYKYKSAGERVFLNPHGGAIAIFTTARIAWVHSNGDLTKELYRNMFGKYNSGEPYRLGDIIRITKNKAYYHKNNLIFFLMGDPALKLGYASECNVVTNSINGNPISEIDTLKALSTATFSGELQDKNGNKLTNFNGSVSPTVYDKERIINTQNNDGEGVYTYQTRDNIIYKGRANVINGEFEFSFIVPRDIALNVDTGKISYYAHNDVFDAKGYSFNFLVGDIAKDYEEDNKGPEIELFMNDENFVSGGITNASPRIFAKLSDEHGINTSSGGIGHDITAIIDDDIQNVIIMNDDYRANANTYKSGELEHFLFNVDAGNHKLKFKVWDVYNNSSEEYLEFLVVEAKNLSIDKLLNYPNPFTTHTDFYFEHNQAGTELDLMIQIFTISGKLVKTIESNFLADGYRAGPYPWDGTDDFGNRIGRGVYVYRVKLRSSTGQVEEKFEKLLILK